MKGLLTEDCYLFLHENGSHVIQDGILLHSSQIFFSQVVMKIRVKFSNFLD